MANTKIEQKLDHIFKVNEKIYILESNEYDIFEAIITKIENGVFSVHYPDWPDDDRDFNSTKRFYPQTDKNTKEFLRQEIVRSNKTKSRNEGSDDESRSSSDDFSDNEKNKKNKKKIKKPSKIIEEPIIKEKIIKEKPIKEKIIKEKPNKEKFSQKESHSQKEKLKHKNEKQKKEIIKKSIINNEKDIYKWIKKAIKDNIDSDQSFLEFLRSNNVSINDEREYINKFNRYLREKYQNDQSTDDYGLTDENDSDKDTFKKLESERIYPPIKQNNDLIKVNELIVPKWININQNTGFSINFKGKNSNSFIYKTKDNRTFLILNGFALEFQTTKINNIDDSNKIFYYKKKKVKPIENVISTHYLEEYMIIENSMKFKQRPLDPFFDQQFKKVKISKTTNLPINKIFSKPSPKIINPKTLENSTDSD